MREMNTSLWELSADSDIAKIYPEVRAQMLPEAVIEAALGAKFEHAAVEADIKIETEIDQRYPGKGPQSLIDGRLGSDVHTSSTWLGFEGRDLIATIDLGERIQLKKLGLNALQNKALGIYMPARIDFSASEDGRDFKPLASLKPSTALSAAGPTTETILSGQLANVSARFVRVHAHSLETIPNGNPAAGRPAWLFTSEIIVNPKLAK